MDIDKRILNDSDYLKNLKLCELRLYKDGDLDWFLLVPMLDGIIDWSDLSIENQMQLTREIDYVCTLLKKYSDYDKINIGSLGNMVPQMHVHIIARRKSDRAWPGSVWGTKSKKSYQDYMHKDWLRRVN